MKSKNMKSEIEKELENFIFLTEEQIQKLEYEQRCLYREKLKSHRDLKNVIDTAREEGEKQARIEIGIKFIKEGTSIEVVSKIMKLSIEEVKAIIVSLNE